MMTIKHMTLSGEEFIYPTSHVNLVPAAAREKPEGGPTPADILWRYDADGRSHPIHSGTCFVMNDHGKTVARYDLSATNVPLSAVAA
jgi:hypothetical protein